MKMLNFGSLNIDHFYEVDHIVRPGETVSSGKYRLACGGKGLNQSVALAHAGAHVFHAGKVGRDGEALLDCLRSAGVNTQYVEVTEAAPSGHAIIQVDKAGQNSIIIHAGANRTIRKEDVLRVLDEFEPGDAILLQNEVSCLAEMVELARHRGLTIFLNPSPMDESVAGCPLDEVDTFIINEIEGRELSGATEPEAIIAAMRRRFPSAATLLTLGERGVCYADRDMELAVPAERVPVVDTTAAGDTFTGFFIAQKISGAPIQDCLRMACRAAALCVSRPGAADSIPFLAELR
ncbi:MAG TPA: ribokinase [Anaerolineales bacterium]|nr:ribokinase [Anaerolineales bacterium]